jgi:hypothetical protein
VSQPDPNAFYGPWALLRTAYSDTLGRFDGGPGQIVEGGPVIIRAG